MLKATVLIFLFLFSGLLAFAQLSHGTRAIEVLQNEIRQSRTDTNKINLLIKLGNAYIDNAGNGKLYVDSSYSYFKLALDLSIKLKNIAWRNRSMEGLAYYYIVSGDRDRAARIENDLMKFYTEKKDILNQAKTWQSLGYYSINLAEGRGYYQKAQILFKKAGDKIDEIDLLNKMARSLQTANKIDSADLVLYQAIHSQQDIGYLKKIHYTYDLLAGDARARGRLDDELFYRLAAVKSMEETHDFQYAPVYYLALATDYKNALDYKRCLYYAQKSFNCGNVPSTYAALSYILGSLRELKQPVQALAFLKKAIKQYPFSRPGEESIALVSFAHCYLALKQYNEAEKYYLLSLQEFIKAKGKVIKDTTDYAVHYTAIIKFFIDTRQFKKAAGYLKAVPPKFDKSINLQPLAQLDFLRYRTSYALGDYFSAIKQLQAYNKLNDSINRATTGRAAQLTQDKYDLEKKDQSIKLLESNQRVQKMTAQKVIVQRNVTLAAIAAALILTGFAYNGYRRKQLSNLLASKKNSQLQILLSEKDWLLKEIHHRVKNNLHTVFCLLESQAKYLSDDALKAIEVSQHRIFAMSLIHQKLYQSDDIKTVDMSVYLSEFIGYLSDSFDTGRYIRFETDIEPITLDIVQAIPVALIINEAVTNAIKYAFPQGKTGIITIAFKQDEKDMSLTVADNGIGIDPLINQQELNSLGLVLMHGLTDDLHGVFTIKNEGGTRISIVFPTIAAWVSSV